VIFGKRSYFSGRSFPVRFRNRSLSTRDAILGCPEFKAAISAKRIAPGPPGVFGMDELDIIVAGYSDGGVSTSCTGFAKQSPGLKLDVTLVRMSDD
jgi:hypothetical protein